MSGAALVAVGRGSTARGTPLLVAYAIANRTNPRGWAWPSIATLAADTGLSPATIKRAVARLEALGELHAERVQGRGNRYRLRLDGIPGNDHPDLSTTGLTMSPVTTLNRAHHDPQPGSPRARTGLTMSREPVKEPVQEPARAPDDAEAWSCRPPFEELRGQVRHADAVD